MPTSESVSPTKKKKADLGAIAFVKVTKLEKRVLELEKIGTKRETLTT